MSTTAQDKTGTKGVRLFTDWRHVNPGENAYLSGGKESAMWGRRPEGVVVPVPDTAYGVRLEAQAGQKVGPLFLCDQPWESAYTMYVSTLLFEDGKYRMWYAPAPDDYVDGTAAWSVDIGLFLCYAESVDGVTWVKPNLGLYEYRGSKDNNIVFGREMNGDGYSSGALFRDDTAAPEERYKLFYKGKQKFPDAQSYETKLTEYKKRFGEDNIDPTCITRGKKDNSILGMFGAVSPDGIHWTPLVEPVLLHFSDTLNNVHLNSKTGEYVAYLRMRRGGRRVVGRASTKDFRFWPKKPEVVLEAPLSYGAGDDIYHGVTSVYPPGSNNHLMFATFFRQLTDSRHVELAVSEDGRYFNIVPGERLVQVGEVTGWTAGDTHIGQGIVQLPNGDLAVPFVGYTETHKAYRYIGKPHGAPGLVTWKRNRIAAIVADEQGSFALKPVTIDGAALKLNFVTTYNGAVSVELRNEDGAVIDGFGFGDCDHLGGDAFDAVVSWRDQGDLSALKGQKVTIRIRLRTAKLFAFEIA